MVGSGNCLPGLPRTLLGVSAVIFSPVNGKHQYTTVVLQSQSNKQIILKCIVNVDNGEIFPWGQLVKASQFILKIACKLQPVSGRLLSPCRAALKCPLFYQLECCEFNRMFTLTRYHSVGSLYHTWYQVTGSVHSITGSSIMALMVKVVYRSSR